MIAVDRGRSAQRLDRGRQVAIGIELVVLIALLVFLGIAAGKLMAVLGRVGISVWKGLPITALFLIAAAFTARRISQRFRALRRGDDDGT